jgi:hypothetical protein
VTFEDFTSQLAMLLRDAPRCTSADITDFAVAYWDGRQVVGIFLRDDGSGRLDEEFDLTEHEFEQWKEEIEAWIKAPKFSVRPELAEWLGDSPPYEAG